MASWRLAIPLLPVSGGARQVGTPTPPCVRGSPDRLGAGRQRAMRTGHSLRCSTLWATLPNSRVARSEWPREPITIRPAPCSLAASRMRRAAEPYKVWRRSTRARSPAASRSLVYCSSWIAPRSPRGGPRGTPDGAGARSRGRRRSHLHRPWRSWRPARPPSRWAWIRQSRAGWCRTSPAHLRRWLGWRQSPLAGTDLPGSLVCRPRTGRQRAAALPGGRRTSVPAVSGRVKRRGGQLEGRLAINSVGNTCLVGKGSVR
jgi:hypothetical protein